MKWLNHIFAFILGTVLLLSSTGIIILQTHCSCTGNESLSFYVAPESCEEDFHMHHPHEEPSSEITIGENRCHESCSSHIETEDCGCSKPDVKYYKLVNFLTNEELKYIAPNSEPVILAAFSNIFTLSGSENVNDEKSEFYSEPPPQITSTLEFLIQINQLKIPDLA